MKLNDLIFSNGFANRFERHLLFWGVVFLYLLVRVSFLFPTEHFWESTKTILSITLIWNLPHNLIATYTVVYVLVPKLFLKKKYIAFALSILFVYFILLALSFLFYNMNAKASHAVGTTQAMPYIYLRATIIRILGNSPLICGLFLAIKTLKNWYQKEAEQAALIKERAAAELQLLKAQIHPHFLFNTLNNIYSFTLTKSPLAAGLVQKLSDMLNYMITDCDQLSVPLQKELQLVEDYISLEKVRYGDRLDIQLHISGDCGDKIIAPLLMIPFVENCFKHGASVMRGRQWMHLIINVNETVLHFEISNSKPSQSNAPKAKAGIGLLNVQKRLALLYPGKHQLVINPTETIFSVRLTLQLETVADAVNKTALNSTSIENDLMPSVHS